MASLNFDNLRNEDLISQKYVYVDFYLDIEEDRINIYDSKSKYSGKDVKVAYDVNAIKNSLTNIFNTMPGDRRLLPEFGLDLRKYLFTPVSKEIAEVIGRDIYMHISMWEPRVRILQVNVIALTDIQEYNIVLNLLIPFYNQRFSFNSILTKEGFYFK